MTVYKIYCDESRQNNAGYKLMGGIWVKKEEGWTFVNEFRTLCDEKLGKRPSHMKWSKVTDHEVYYNFYKYLVDLYFKYNIQNKMFFKTIIVDDNYDFNHNDYHGGDFEVGFYKLYYHMIKSTFKSNSKYHLRIAKRTVSRKIEDRTEIERLEDLKMCLNRQAARKSRNPFSPFNNHYPVLSVEPRKASSRRLIQVADILMGAVGYHWNKEHEKSNTKVGKVLLANYIAKKLGKENLIFTTNYSNSTFNIFYMKV